MKRFLLMVVLLLGGAVSAHADNDIYNNALKRPRGAMPARRHRDRDARPARRKTRGHLAGLRCMRAQAGVSATIANGWRDDRYPDPDNPG